MKYYCYILQYNTVGYRFIDSAKLLFCIMLYKMLYVYIDLLIGVFRSNAKQLSLFLTEASRQIGPLHTMAGDDKNA